MLVAMTEAMITQLTWIVGLSSLLQSLLLYTCNYNSLTSTTMHTAVEQLDYTAQLQLTPSQAPSLLCTR